MIYLADLSGLIFLSATGMLYATWKLYREQENAPTDSDSLIDSPSPEGDEITRDPIQL